MTEKMRERSGDMMSIKLGWKNMEPRPQLIDQSNNATFDDADSITKNLFLPGSGIARSVIEAL